MIGLEPALPAVTIDQRELDPVALRFGAGRLDALMKGDRAMRRDAFA